MNNLDFIDDIIKYIKEKFSSDVDFSQIKVDTAYRAENSLETPEIDVFLANDMEDESSNSFDKENISIKVVTFYCYNEAMIFNGNQEKSNAVVSTMTLSDKLINVFEKNQFAQNNQNVISLVRRNYIPPQNLRDNMVYVSIIKYEIKVLNNYVKIYNE